MFDLDNEYVLLIRKKVEKIEREVEQMRYPNATVLRYINGFSTAKVVNGQSRR